VWPRARYLLVLFSCQFENEVESIPYNSQVSDTILFLNYGKASSDETKVYPKYATWLLSKLRARNTRERKNAAASKINLRMLSKNLQCIISYKFLRFRQDLKQLRQSNFIFWSPLSSFFILLFTLFYFTFILFYYIFYFTLFASNCASV